MLFLKTSDEVLDYEILYSSLLLEGEEIIASSWSVSPESSPPLVIDSSEFTVDLCKVWLSGGGDIRSEYALTNIIETSQGRTYERGFTLQMVETR
jgi:hypothetical protein